MSKSMCTPQSEMLPPIGSGSKFTVDRDWTFHIDYMRICLQIGDIHIIEKKVEFQIVF